MGSGSSAWSLASGIGGSGGGLYPRSVVSAESRGGAGSNNLLVTRQYCSFGSTVTYLFISVKQEYE